MNFSLFHTHGKISASSWRLFARDDRLATDSDITKLRDVFMHARKCVDARKRGAINVSLGTTDQMRRKCRLAFYGSLRRFE